MLVILPWLSMQNELNLVHILHEAEWSEKEMYSLWSFDSQLSHINSVGE